MGKRVAADFGARTRDGGCRWAIQKLGPLVLKEVSIALFYVVGVLWLPILRSEAQDLSWQALAFAIVFFIGLA